MTSLWAAVLLAAVRGAAVVPYGYATIDTDPLVLAFNRIVMDVKQGRWAAVEIDLAGIEEQFTVARDRFHEPLREEMRGAVRRRDPTRVVELLAAAVDVAIREKFRITMDEKMGDAGAARQRLLIARSLYMYALSGNPMAKDRAEGTRHHAATLAAFDRALQLASDATTGAVGAGQLQELAAAGREVERNLRVVYPWLAAAPQRPAP